MREIRTRRVSSADRAFLTRGGDEVKRSSSSARTTVRAVAYSRSYGSVSSTWRRLIIDPHLHGVRAGRPRAPSLIRTLPRWTSRSAARRRFAQRSVTQRQPRLESDTAVAEFYRRKIISEDRQQIPGGADPCRVARRRSRPARSGGGASAPSGPSCRPLAARGGGALGPRDGGEHLPPRAEAVPACWRS